MKKLICIMGVLILTVTGCQKQQNESQREDVQYAVCRQSVLPKELKQIIKEEKKEAAGGLSDEEIEARIAARAAAKKAKNYAEADKIRAELAEQGIVLTDTPAGTTFARK